MKNIVFDFGGVLFRWQPHNLLARVWPHRVPDAAAAAPVVAQFFQHYTGDWSAFDQGLIDADEVGARIAARTGWPRAEIDQVMAAVPGELELLTGTVALIEELKAAGHRLFFLSNMPVPYAEHLERSHPLHHWFEAGVFSGRVQQAKPDAAIYRTATAQFGVAPESCLFLDDHPANIEAARAEGWQALHFTTAEAARPQLHELGLLL